MQIKPVEVEHAGQAITLNGWDFGGQQVYRPTHQLFFTAPAVYLVVWNLGRDPRSAGQADPGGAGDRSLAPDGSGPGQVRSVQAHRLLVTNSVDERMIELLAAKSRLFDYYARRSDVAENSPDAVGISEVDLARRIVATEQERMAREATEKSVDNPT